MFTWLNKQGVKSSDGFILQSVHRFYYHYIEDDHIMQIDVEPGRFKSGLYHERIFLNSKNRWLPPYEAESVTEQKLAEIKKNISDALDFMQISHSFEE